MNEPKSINKQTLITYLALIIMFSVDQLTKQMVINAMPIDINVETHTFSSYPAYQFLPWLWIYHVVNFGVAFSMFYGKTLILSIFALIVSTGLIIYERRTYKVRTALFSLSLGLILSGALGNLTDRIRLGYVTDFLAFMNNGKLIWPIFNVADICVNIGVGLLVINLLLYGDKPEPKTASKEEIKPQTEE